jgi:hypothetical protein
MNMKKLGVFVLTCLLVSCAPKPKIWVDEQNTKWKEIGLTKTGRMQLENTTTHERIDIDLVVMKIVMRPEK